MLQRVAKEDLQIVGVRSEKGGEVALSKPINRPGQKADISGQYEIVRKGKGTGVERTVTRGEPLPPTPKPSDRYRLVDRTKH